MGRGQPLLPCTDLKFTTIQRSFFTSSFTLSTHADPQSAGEKRAAEMDGGNPGGKTGNEELERLGGAGARDFL
jgi:hypothetical protein